MSYEKFKQKIKNQIIIIERDVTSKYTKPYKKTKFGYTMNGGWR